MTITVRTAAARDMEWLMIQLRAFDQFAGYKRSLIEDEAHAWRGLKQLVDDHVVFIAESQCGHVPGDCAGCAARLGFIAGYKTPHPFNPRLRVLTESFWWVAPERRGESGGAGLLLLNEFEAYGRRYCDWTIMTLEHHSPVNARHLTKRGFFPREQSYLLEV